MRKVIGWSLILYVCFGVFIYWYLYYGSSSAIPAAYKGSSADPHTFMSARELILSQEYSVTKYLLYFLSTPLEWIILLFLLVTGVSKRLETWAKETTSKQFVHIGIYLLYLSLITTLLSLPLQWIGYQVSKSYQISVQTTQSWIKEQVIDFWVNYGLMFVVVAVLFLLIQKSQKRWWLYAWALSIPFTVFLTFIQPVIIDPLYNDFSPLKNKQLEGKILQLAEQADIPAQHVYEVNMSEKTNALNAYVTGIGSNSRIVLWDTTLNRLKDNEILFIMAHEMGHYVMKHIYWGVGAYILLSFIGLYLISKIMNFMIARYGKTLKISSVASFSSLPLLLLIMSMLSFAVNPLSNYVSRMEEHAADQYALEMTNNSKAAVETFQELSKSSLSQVNPPGLVKFFFYTHPTIFERINYFEEYGKGKR
ncbi:M48 family metallopeptidase [Bacillus sp. 165]|uniref:M48 family metallopeptidase n=1 Tax=Bacillus sp. 165 TaxID=1529117 RepID=UPI001ADA962F|nr:M48 family metallopeptidase [Bacillus sp. 165]MBO9128711.1 M48 family metallopeptidase [Bacillus sp. 165]